MISARSEEYYKKDHRQETIPKCSFHQKKTRRDGLVLQLHHTLPEAGTNVRGYRFISASFDLSGERLAVSDSQGNAFVIDLLSSKFWMLPKLPASNFIIFSRYAPRKQDILVGCVTGPLSFINADTGEITGELPGHKSSPLSASFAEDEPYCLTVSSTSAIIWDLRSNSLVHQLTLRSSVGIKLVKFMPVSNNILGLFDDSSVHIWKLDSLECTKQIFPEEWGGQNVKAVAITRNGRGMVMGGLSAALAVFLLDNWTLQKLIALPDNYRGVKQLEFVPQLFDGGANKILAVISSSCSLLFLDTETSVLLKTVDQLDGCINRLETSLSGKYLVSVVQTGQVNIYASSQVLSWGHQEGLVSESQGPRPTRASKRDLQTSAQTSVLLDINRLRPILKEFGEYPDNHRRLIWKSILRLPENEAAYIALINKGIHPAFSSLEKDFPLADRSLLSSVKRLLSCLAYWSPIFLQVKYLPIFVLPFVKQIKHDQFACFEAVATVIVNWCQGWFQFVPYPALNVLDSVSLLLSSHDNQLASHYSQCHVTADVYIWSLLETAFYEVLGWSEWQQLWDHILSNHPAFFLFAVVAFNITCRTSLLNLQHVDDFQHFFHKEVVINMKQFIGKCYQLWANTSSDVHPKRQIRSFQPLIKGNMYQVFTDYPKHLLDNQLEKLSGLYEDKVALELQEKEVIKQKRGVDAEKKELELANARQSRSRELEDAYKRALRREDDILESQRRHISTAWRDLREKEVTVRSQIVDKTLQEKAEKYAELDRLMEKIGSKNGASELQSVCDWSLSQPSTDPGSLRLQHASVAHHLSKLKKMCRQTKGANPQLKLCVSKFEDLLARIEMALDREQSSKLMRPCQMDQILTLEEETRALEDEAQQLLKELTLSISHCSKCSRSKESLGTRAANNSCYCCGDTKNRITKGVK